MGTSDEDVSTTGSPSIRRRLGSCSGGPDQLSTKEDTYSPGNHLASNLTLIIVDSVDFTLF